jgi:hypothetical protein
VLDRLSDLRHELELCKTVLLVREPASPVAAEAFEGLRRQVVAGAAERRSHLSQLVAMAVAVDRASSVDDLAAQVGEWLDQAGVVEVREPEPDRLHLLFDDVDGGTLEGVDAVEVVEPAYVDSSTGAVLRAGRARAVGA